MLTANKLHSDTNNTEGSGERGTKRMRERERQLDGGGVVGVWRLGQRANSVGPTPLTPGDKWQVQCWRRCCMQHAWERQRRFDLSPSLSLTLWSLLDLEVHSSFEVSSLQPKPSIHGDAAYLPSDYRIAMQSFPASLLPTCLPKMPFVTHDNLVIMPELPFALAYQQRAQLANNNDNNSKHPWSTLRILFIVAKAQSLSRTRVCLHKDMSAISFICTRSKAAKTLYLPSLPCLPSRTRQATPCRAPAYP